VATFKLSALKLFAIKDMNHPRKCGVVGLNYVADRPARFVKTETMKPGCSYPERLLTEPPTLNGMSVISSPKAAAVGSLFYFVLPGSGFVFARRSISLSATERFSSSI
jgi:hypothetical protein